MRYILILLLILGFVSCNEEPHKKDSDKIKSKPETVIIAGKAFNFDPKNPNLGLNVNRVGIKRLNLNSKIDSSGNLHVSFESYLPTDVWLSYNSNFLVITHPGDSIHITFDAGILSRQERLETIEFSGDAIKTNQDAAKLQQMYYSSYNYENRSEERGKANKEYKEKEFLQYLDTIKEKNEKIFEAFVEKYQPNEETEIWAKIFLERDYYNELAFYPINHRNSNKLKALEWDVSENYFREISKRLPITKPMLISGYAMMGFINGYHFNYSIKKTFSEKPNKKYVSEDGFGFTGSEKDMDSIALYGIVKHTKDPLMRQLVLAERFRFSFDKSEIDLYENYHDLVKEYIKEPFLKKPLEKRYREIKHHLESPKEAATETLLKKAEKTSVKELMDSLLIKNKGKVIYVDTWATWCGPCIAEFPNSKKLMRDLKDKEVVFAYVNLLSNEAKWKAMLDKYQLGGEHYFLNRNQSEDFWSVFGINGIPHYLLFNQEGTLIDDGSYLRPNVAGVKIDSLLINKNAKQI